VSTHDITFDDDVELPQGRPERYRGREGVTDRIGFVFFRVDPGSKPDLSKPRLVAARVQFHPQLHSVISRQGEPDADESIWARFPEPPRLKAATLVLRYPTDPKGRVQKDQFAAPIPMLVWEFGAPIFERLKKLHEEQKAKGSSLGAVDVSCTCTNERYQRFELRVAGPAIWRMREEYAARTVERASKHYSQITVGRDLTDEQLRQELGLITSAEVEEPSFDTLMDEV
jgi:hypothetical protein